MARHLLGRLGGALTAAALLLSPLAVPGVAGPAAAATATPTPSVRVINYNLCGGYIDDCESTLGLNDWANTLAASLKGWNPDAVMFEELCKGQLDAAAARLPGYQEVWLETGSVTDAAKSKGYGCGKWLYDGAPKSNAPIGIGMLVKATAAPQPLGHLLRNVAPGREQRGVVCAQVPVNGISTLLCTTHTSPEMKDEGAPQVVTAIRGWAHGGPVILGGDFNADTQDSNMGQYYIAQGGNGEFNEADQANRAYFSRNCTGLAACRSGSPTAGHRDGTKVVNGQTIPDHTHGITRPDRKFDYLFASAAYFGPATADTADAQFGGNSLSDHVMYRGVFPQRPDTQAPATPLVAPGSASIARQNDWLNAVDHTSGDFNGDGKTDLVLRNAAGTVTLYPGDGNGHFGIGIQLVSAAQGWWDAKSITAGDFNGDGKTDLLARWTSGRVFLYPGDGHGHLGNSVEVMPAGSLTNAADIVAGDFNGDGKTDLVVRWNAANPWENDGHVTFYPGNGDGTFGTSTELVSAAQGWWDASDITAGDFNGDGKADLLVRWTSGSAFLYPGDGQGHLGASVPVVAAPTWATARDLTAGDFNGDGRTDLLIRWTNPPSVEGRPDPPSITQKVDFLPGDGKGGFGTARSVRPVGSGGWLDAARVIPGNFTSSTQTDLLVQWNSGSVFLYPNGGSGTFNSSPRLIAADWSDAKSITAGTFLGDGNTDLLVRWSSGSVFLYPGNGNGTFGGSIPLLPAGSWSNAVDVVGGDFNGDGKADVVIRWNDGHVTFEPGNGDGTFGTPTELVSAAQGWTDAVSVTAGDFNGDGKTDLLVRWTAGSAFLYPGNGNGTFGGSVAYQPAGAWSDLVNVLPGQYTVDGSTSLILRWNDGAVVPGYATSDRLTIRASDDRGRVSHFVYSLDVPLDTTNGTRLDARNNIVSLPLAGFAPGSHTLYVAAVDLAGNRSATQAYAF
ncbi:FG-GAP-like repeat-containing protein [Kitasatospora sp. McL0602]|uniref:FG-GAP-like repeat-containing protein n=1 Tax=Kitasatospora sp. McL0602 TaxID=3439530 RepID=UPI003F8AE241